MRAPVPDAYWVVPGRLLAGPHPGPEGGDEARRRVAALVAAGITRFVDLTHDEDALPAYAPLLPDHVRVVRRPIVDFGCPAPDEMRATLDAIDAELERGESVYVHCWGGRGRTGTVVGCWLVRRGATGDEALARIEQLRRAVAAGGSPSPETDEQRALVRAWREVEAGATPAA